MNQVNQERALGRLWAHLAGLRGRLAGLEREQRRHAGEAFAQEIAKTRQELAQARAWYAAAHAGRFGRKA
jgi:predicted transcriptional regulator